MKHLTDRNYCYFCGCMTKRRGWSSFECWSCKNLSKNLKEFIKLLHAIDWVRTSKDADKMWEGFATRSRRDRYIVWDKIDKIRRVLTTRSGATA